MMSSGGFLFRRFLVICLGLISAPWAGAYTQDGKYGSEDDATNNENDGKFYEMSAWSQCSRTCGIGIKFRGMLCLRESRELCKPQKREYATCNTQDCPSNSQDFRHVQCARYNDKNILVSGGRGTWVPHPRGKERCMLFCHPVGQGLYYYFGRAKDGTQCSEYPSPYSVCVYDQCKPVGCDKVLGSGVYEDKCGVCGGNNTDCHRRRGQILKQPTDLDHSGYTDVLVIPKGATNVIVSDTTRNYLAVKRADGDYVFNGNKILVRPQTFGVDKMKLRYERANDRINESLRIRGPTTEVLHVTILLVTSPASCTFEYWLPKTAVKEEEERQAFAASYHAHETPRNGPTEWGPWMSCSVSCGSGIRVRARQCEGGPDTPCLDVTSQIAKCNNRPCGPHWSEWSPWNACSASCGMGVRIRFRRCIGSRLSVRATCPGSKYKVDYCDVLDCPEIVVETTTTKPPLETGVSTESTKITSQEPNDASFTNASGIRPSTTAQPPESEVPADQTEKHESRRSSYKTSAVTAVGQRESSALQRPLLTQITKTIAETTAEVNRQVVNQTEHTAGTRQMSYAVTGAPSVSSLSIEVYTSIGFVTHSTGTLVGIMSSQSVISSPESRILSEARATMSLDKTAAFVSQTAYGSSSSRSDKPLGTSMTYRSSHRRVMSSHAQSLIVGLKRSSSVTSTSSSGHESVARMQSISKQTLVEGVTSSSLSSSKVKTHLSPDGSEATLLELVPTMTVPLIKDERTLTKFQIASSSRRSIIYSSTDTPYVEVAATIRKTANISQSKLTQKQSPRSFKLAESIGLPRFTTSLMTQEMRMPSGIKQHTATKALASLRMETYTQEKIVAQADVTMTVSTTRKPAYKTANVDIQTEGPGNLLTRITLQSKHSLSMTVPMVTITSEIPVYSSYATPIIVPAHGVSIKLSETLTVHKEIHSYGSAINTSLVSSPSTLDGLSVASTKAFTSQTFVLVEPSFVRKMLISQTSQLESASYSKQPTKSLNTTATPVSLAASTGLSSIKADTDKISHLRLTETDQTYTTRFHITSPEERTVGIREMMSSLRLASSKELSTTAAMQVDLPMVLPKSRTQTRLSGSRETHPGVLSLNTSSTSQVQAARVLVSSPATLDLSLKVISKEIVQIASTRIESSLDGKQPTTSLNTKPTPAIHVMLTTSTKLSSVQADKDETTHVELIDKDQSHTTRIRTTKAEERTAQQSELTLSLRPASSRERLTTATMQTDSPGGSSSNKTQIETSTDRKEQLSVSQNISSSAQALENVPVTTSTSISHSGIIHQSTELVSTRNPLTEVSAAFGVTPTRNTASSTIVRQQSKDERSVNLYDSSQTAVLLSMTAVVNPTSTNPTSRSAEGRLISPVYHGASQTSEVPSNYITRSARDSQGRQSHIKLMGTAVKTGDVKSTTASARNTKMSDEKSDRNSTPSSRPPKLHLSPRKSIKSSITQASIVTTSFPDSFASVYGKSVLIWTSPVVQKVGSSNTMVDVPGVKSPISPEISYLTRRSLALSIMETDTRGSVQSNTTFTVLSTPAHKTRLVNPTEAAGDMITKGTSQRALRASVSVPRETVTSEGPGLGSYTAFALASAHEKASSSSTTIITVDSSPGQVQPSLPSSSPTATTDASLISTSKEFTPQASTSVHSLVVKMLANGSSLFEHKTDSKRSTASLNTVATPATPSFLSTSTTLSSDHTATDKTTHPAVTNRDQTFSRRFVTKADGKTVGVSEVALSPSPASGKGLVTATINGVDVTSGLSVSRVQTRPLTGTEMQPGGFAPNTSSSSHVPVNVHVTSSTDASDSGSINLLTSLSPVRILQTTSQSLTEISRGFSLKPTRSMISYTVVAQLSKEKVLKIQSSSQTNLLASITTMSAKSRDRTMPEDLTVRSSESVLVIRADRTPQRSENANLHFSTSRSVVSQESQHNAPTTTVQIDNEYSTTVRSTGLFKEIVVSSLVPSPRVIALSTAVFSYHLPVASAPQSMVVSSKGTLENFPENIKTTKMRLKSSAHPSATPRRASVIGTGNSTTKAVITSTVDERKPTFSSYSTGQGTNGTFLSFLSTSHPSLYFTSSSQFFLASPKSAFLQTSDNMLGLHIKTSTTSSLASSSPSRVHEKVADPTPLKHIALTSKAELNTLVSSHSKHVVSFSTEDVNPDLYSSSVQPGLQSFSFIKTKEVISSGNVYSETHEGTMDRKILKSTKTSEAMQSSQVNVIGVSASSASHLRSSSAFATELVKPVFPADMSSEVMSDTVTAPAEQKSSVRHYTTTTKKGTTGERSAQHTISQTDQTSGMPPATSSIGPLTSWSTSEKHIHRPVTLTGKVPMTSPLVSMATIGSADANISVRTKSTVALQSSPAEQGPSPVVVRSSTQAVAIAPSTTEMILAIFEVSTTSSSVWNVTSTVTPTTEKTHAASEVFLPSSRVWNVTSTVTPTTEKTHAASEVFSPSFRVWNVTSTVTPTTEKTHAASEVSSQSSGVRNVTSTVTPTTEKTHAASEVSSPSSSVWNVTSTVTPTTEKTHAASEVSSQSSGVWNVTSTVTPTTITEECPPCQPLRKRKKMYCLSDYVLQVEVRFESKEDHTHEVTYFVRVKQTFKSKVALKDKTQILVTHDKCRCPELRPKNEYLVMGYMSDEDTPTLRLNRQSYFQPWKPSMTKRLKSLKDIPCPDKPTQASVYSSPKPDKLVTKGPSTDKVTTVLLTKKTSPTIPTTRKVETYKPEPITTLEPSILPPRGTTAVTCEPCRPSNKRNKSFCESDFVLRVKILKESYNTTSGERFYFVRIKGSFKPGLQFRLKERIWATNVPPACKCPDFLLEREYIIMGNLARQQDEQEPRLTIGPRSFARVWKGGMQKKLESLDGVCKSS